MEAAVGDQCVIVRPDSTRLLSEVIGFSDRTAYLMPYDSYDSLQSGMTVIRQGKAYSAGGAGRLQGASWMHWAGRSTPRGRFAITSHGRSIAPHQRRLTAPALANRSLPVFGPSTRC